MRNILIVDDDIAIVESLKFAFKDKYNLFLHYEAEPAFNCYLREDISVTILDLKLGSEDGMDLYERIKDVNPEAVVIIITGYGTIQSSVEAIKKGVFYYLTKPIDLKELEILIEKGIEVDDLHRKINELDKRAKSKYEDFGIIAKSDSMKRVLNTIEKIKNIDSNVLITGESGTGKV